MRSGTPSPGNPVAKWCLISSRGRSTSVTRGEGRSMALGIVTADAFTSRPFSGNPAAVCVLPGPADPAWMQNVAREMNLAETAFLEPRPDGFGLRWFTPTMEVDLCGHATLASAHVLWESGRLAASEQARFHTRSGLLTATRRHDWIELDLDRKSTRLNSSHSSISYAVFCLK